MVIVVITHVKKQSSQHGWEALKYENNTKCKTSKVKK